MRKNYRSLSLLLTAGMMAGALAGCGQTSATQTSPQVYTDTSAEVYESPASSYAGESAPVCEEPLLGAEKWNI